MSRVESWLGRLYGARLNPLHHTGTLVVAMLIVLVATGVYLLLFYRIGSPYASTAAITEQAWAGRWIRSLHRFVSDASVVLIVVHATKMFVQSRAWGARALAWLTGCGLLALFLVCGWTGYVMVWDVQGQVLAVEGAKILDLLPILSEPLSRQFVGDQPVPNAFFFTNLFLHVALPLGLGLLFWVHVARSARARLLPPAPVTWTAVGALAVVAIAWPVGMAAEADLLTLPRTAAFDVFFAGWLPAARAVGPVGVWGVGASLMLAALLVPWFTRPRKAERPGPAVVDERLCTGCEQCAHDCPYEAITMVERTDGRATLVARVDTSLCVSCGICSASCAPMVVGPPGRSGRDQLARVKRTVAGWGDEPPEVVVIGCRAGAGGIAAFDRIAGASVVGVDCAGSVHTSVVEGLLRGGAAGVMIVSCHTYDCRNREGPKWLEQRLFEGREAELQERVDRTRVRWIEAGAAERPFVLEEVRRFAESLRPGRADEGDEMDLLALCDRSEAAS